MIDDELIQRCTRCNQNRDRRPCTPSGAADALPTGSNRAGISGKDGDVQTAYIDPQFQCIGGDYPSNAAFAQTPLDAASLVWKISTPISNDCFVRDGTVFKRF